MSEDMSQFIDTFKNILHNNNEANFNSNQNTSSDVNEHSRQDIPNASNTNNSSLNTDGSGENFTKVPFSLIAGISLYSCNSPLIKEAMAVLLSRVLSTINHREDKQTQLPPTPLRPLTFL